MLLSKTLPLWAFAPLLAVGILVPSSALPAGAASLISENRARDADIAAQSETLRGPAIIAPRASSPEGALPDSKAAPTECLHVHLDHGDC